MKHKIIEFPTGIKIDIANEQKPINISANDGLVVRSDDFDVNFVNMR